jgi:heat shock protein HslJ/uncharacterized protein YecT (DUF1311 family)
VRMVSMLLIAAAGVAGTAASATPLQDCTQSSVPSVCLDAKLKAANKQLNATLKAAQDRIEQLQAQGRRPVLGTFIDSQRKFNAYRDAQCGWQGIRAPAGSTSADYVKDCQIRETLARERQLAEFLAGAEVSSAGADGTPMAEADSAPANVEVLPSSNATIADAAVDPPKTALPVPESPAIESPKAAAPSDGSAQASRASEWRLVRWVANGAEKIILGDSAITLALNPSGKVAGNASLNRFTGNYRFDADGRLQWPRTGFTLTRMAGPAPLMGQERAFLDSLRRTAQYRVEGPQLVLESEDGTTVLTFAR